MKSLSLLTVGLIALLWAFHNFVAPFDANLLPAQDWVASSDVAQSDSEHKADAFCMHCVTSKLNECGEQAMATLSSSCAYSAQAGPFGLSACSLMGMLLFSAGLIIGLRTLDRSKVNL